MGILAVLVDIRLVTLLDYLVLGTIFKNRPVEKQEFAILECTMQIRGKLMKLMHKQTRLREWN